MQLTPKRDVWDLGCLAFQVLTGRGLLILRWKSKRTMSPDHEDESQEKRRKVRKFEYSFTSRIYLARPSRLQLSDWKTLHQNPKKRPTSAEFVSMMQLCDPEFCMEQIEDVADRSNPGKVGRAKSLIGDQTTQNLVREHGLVEKPT